LLGHLLSFACGIMLYISVADMLPHSVSDLGWFAAHQWFITGMLFFGVIVWLVPEPDLPGVSEETPPPVAALQADEPPKPQGPRPRGRPRSRSRSRSAGRTPTAPSAAAGTAPPAGDSAAAEAARNSSRLYMTGLIAALGISLHNFPEGLIVFSQSLTGVCSAEFGELTVASAGGLMGYLGAASRMCGGRGMALFFAIALHNIPEGMAVASPIYAATGSAWQSMKWCIISSLCEPLAAALLIPAASALTAEWAAILNAFVAGIMVMLCVVELIPTAAKYSGAYGAGLSHVLGQVVMFLSLQAMIKAGLH